MPIRVKGKKSKKCALDALGLAKIFNDKITTDKKHGMISGLREEIHFHMVKMVITILPDILMESIKNSQLPQGLQPQVNMGDQTFF